MQESVQEQINSYMVEVHKKYALPVACIVFILIGAPLGVMVRRGGFGVAASISLFFFVIYWAFLIGGEKLADRDFITPFWGMWSANILLSITGIILTTKTVQETIILNFNFLKKLIPKQLRNLFQVETNESGEPDQA
jgi:lipopolysaccharide export system permease protein